jgi:predicted DNA repair protein MutK
MIMAAGLLALLDDISVLMDDVSTMSQVATKKTAGILGDDLAVNAEKASGFASSRELPVLWAITKGSFINKIIILPFAFLLSAFAPWIIVPILMVGGVYLAYEGAEKIYEYFFHHEEKKHIETLEQKSKEEILTEEKAKIKSAVITDFILSIEIIIIALSAVASEPMAVQIAAVSFVAFVATVGVYGIVALLVRMDDFGYKLIAINGGQSSLGEFFVRALPKVITALTVIGTIAMLLVAGGIFVHNSHFIHDFVGGIPFIFGELLVGFIIGVVAVAVIMLIKRVKA